MTTAKQKPKPARTLKALKGSIQKWAKIVRSTRALDRGIRNCDLCGLFNNGSNCKGCPVAEKTRDKFCNGSPYSAWSLHHELAHSDTFPCHRYRGCAECLRLAKAELVFLESLLPKKRAARRVA